jgi:uncharacterized protein (TIGR03437 family)
MPSLTPNPSSLAFNYQTGGSAPSSQSIAVSTSNGASAAFSVSAATTSGGNWLLVSPSNGATPTTVTVTVNPAGLAVASYNGSITISAPGFNSQTVAVNLAVTKPKSTIVVSGNTTFGLANTSAPATGTLTISTSDGTALPFTVAAGQTTSNFITFSPASGTTQGKINLTVNPAHLIPGVYVNQLTITVPGTVEGSKVVPVQLTVTGANLTASPATLVFTYQPGTALPAAQTLTVAPAPGSGQVALASITASGTWLKVSQAASLPATIQVSVEPSLLTPGNYQGNIYFTGAGSPAPSLAYPVSLTVNPLPQLAATPAALSFSYQTGGAAPASQSFALSTGGVPLNFTVLSSGNWLSVSPAQGATPGSVLVTADPTGLAPGTYGGAIKASAYGAANSPISIAVTLTVTGSVQLTVTPAQLSFAVPAGGPAPAAQTVAVSSNGPSPVSFTAASGSPWLSVTPTSGATPASLSVAVNPAGLKSGTYTGAITVTPAGNPSGARTVAVTLQVGSGTTGGAPVILGVINAASGAIGTVAPGMALSIFGHALGPVTGVGFVSPASGGTVATTLGGTQVLFDGTAAPVLFAQDGQVNVVAPFELTGKTSTVMQVVFNGSTSAGMTLTVAEAEPGLFTADGSGKGQGAILNQDYSANSASKPAPVGSAIMLFGTGGGQTIPPSIDGGINPMSSQGKLVLPVTVTIGGQPAQVLYYGPAPGLVAGIMQVNAVIPSGTPSGPAAVVVQVGTAESQTVTVTVQ